MVPVRIPNGTILTGTDSSQLSILTGTEKRLKQSYIAKKKFHNYIHYLQKIQLQKYDNMII